MAAPLTLIKILSALYLVSMMFALGLELGGGPKESTEGKRAKRRMLVRGLFLNLVVLPLVAFGITRALDASRDVSVALVLLAAVPGGRYAPHLVKLGGGDTALAIELALFLSKITCFTAVPTAKWMLTLHTLEIHELPFLLQLVLLQLVPFYLGKWLRRAHRPAADRMLRPAHTIAVATAVAAFAFVLIKVDRGVLHLFDGRSWLAVTAVGIMSPLVGWLFGGRDEGGRRAFAITANARELALALVMTSLAFPGQGVHTALFGVWSMLAVASFLLACGMRTYGGVAPQLRAGGRAPGGPAGARSGSAR